MPDPETEEYSSLGVTGIASEDVSDIHASWVSHAKVVWPPSSFLTLSGDVLIRSRFSRPGVVVGTVIAGLGGLFVARALVRDWEVVRTALGQTDVGWLAIAFALGCVSMAGIGLSWWRALHLVGVRSRPRDAIRWYFVGQLGKYLPGGVWPVIGRAELATQDGAPRTRTYPAVLLSIGATYLAAMLTLSALLALAPGLLVGVPGALWLLILVPIGLALVHPSVVNSLVRWLGRVPGLSLDLRVPTWSASIRLVLYHVPSWLGIGVATWCIVQGLGEEAAVSGIMAAAILAWVVGFLALPVPGGLGVREATFVLAAGSLSGGVAAATAILARAVFVLVDIIGAVVCAWALPGRRRQPAGPFSENQKGSSEAPPSARPSNSKSVGGGAETGQHTS